MQEGAWVRNAIRSGALLSLVAIVGCASNPTGCADVPRASTRVDVTDARTGVQLCNATVSIVGRAPCVLVSCSDHWPSFDCGHLPAGNHVVSVSMSGYQDQQKSVTLTARECGETSIDVEVHLERM